MGSEDWGGMGQESRVRSHGPGVKFHVTGVSGLGSCVRGQE